MRASPPKPPNITNNPSSLFPKLPPHTLQWSTAAAAGAAISYADRGTSAIAASSLLEELRWSEGQLGEVQSAFFVGYALTQVLGGVLGGRRRGSGTRGRPNGDEIDDINDGGGGGYRFILPLSLFLTGVTTLLFPIASTVGGYKLASVDRFCLGLFEGLLLPSAMAGVSDTTSALGSDLTRTDDNIDTANDNKATASSIVIAGCYLGSALSYLSAWFLFSEAFQLQLIDWEYQGPVWPLVFYVNGLLSMVCLVVFREEFDLNGSSSTPITSMQQTNIWEETLTVAKETLTSKSGRAILAAQIGQGALLYSIASWGPLYLERIGTTSTLSLDIDSAASAITSISSVAVTASIAASSLILPQLTQALVGVSIGTTADQLSSVIGTRFTRRVLQLLSGVGPAVILWYLTTANSGDEYDPTLLFGAAQTLSALSLGAVSVSHLDIATPSTAGAVYALGNVAAAASGSVMVNLFGTLLEKESGGFGLDAETDGQEFALPFQIVAFLSAVGSSVYALTVETDLQIGDSEDQ